MPPCSLLSSSTWMPRWEAGDCYWCRHWISPVNPPTWSKGVLCLYTTCLLRFGEQQVYEMTWSTLVTVLQEDQVKVWVNTLVWASFEYSTTYSTYPHPFLLVKTVLLPTLKGSSWLSHSCFVACLFTFLTIAIRSLSCSRDDLIAFLNIDPAYMVPALISSWPQFPILCLQVKPHATGIPFPGRHLSYITYFKRATERHQEINSRRRFGLEHLCSCIKCHYTFSLSRSMNLFSKIVFLQADFLDSDAVS